MSSRVSLRTSEPMKSQLTRCIAEAGNWRHVMQPQSGLTVCLVSCMSSLLVLPCVSRPGRRPRGRSHASTSAAAQGGRDWAFSEAHSRSNSRARQQCRINIESAVAVRR